MNDEYIFRYVCPCCLKTFLDRELQLYPFCFDCASDLVVITSEKIIYLEWECEVES